MATSYIHQRAKLGELADRQVTELAEGLSKLTIENELRRKILNDIARLRDMKSYRGTRHMFQLPVRGQNTRSQVQLSVYVALTYVLTFIRSKRRERSIESNGEWEVARSDWTWQRIEQNERDEHRRRPTYGMMIIGADPQVRIRPL